MFSLQQLERIEKSEKENDLLWKISDDLKRFKETTKGYPIIMGRKTFDSIGRPLPKRINIIVTRDESYRQEGCVVVHSIEKAFETAKNTGAEKIFVIGGGEIYKQALPFATHLDLTRIDAGDDGADAFFPEFENEFKEVAKEKPREGKRGSIHVCTIPKKVVDLLFPNKR